MSLKIDTNGIDLDAFAERLNTAVLMYADTKSTQMESYAKSNRKWTDRTGQAKATMRSVVSQPRKNLVRITLSHGVDYGIWLELANEKRYAIVIPTVEKFGPEVMNGLNGLLNRLRG